MPVTSPPHFALFSKLARISGSIHSFKTSMHLSKRDSVLRNKEIRTLEKTCWHFDSKKYSRVEKGRNSLMEREKE
jgi:hypothetical protein